MPNPWQAGTWQGRVDRQKAMLWLSLGSILTAVWLGALSLLAHL
jgi:hypothetical protein